MTTGFINALEFSTSGKFLVAGVGQEHRPPSHRRSLQRTLSDESIYRGQRPPPLLSDTASEQALASDVLFSCSTVPRSPTTRGVPLRRPSYKLGVKLHGDLSASDTSLVELVERQRRPLPQELMPLPPSSNRDSPMDWTHLVDVANTFEGESICADVHGNDGN
ncbi:hypothetical protein CRUP_012325 [Coryphaenoides rupestris]|nr:hypothetical protein CRUP_012325 [Coryphaenoides rupestris]